MRSHDRVGRLRRAARLCLVVGLVLGVVGVALHPADGPVGYATRGLATGGGGHGLGAVENVTVNMTDASPYYDPANLSLTAGDTVDFTLYNLGQYPHTFTLAAVGNFTIPTSYSPTQLNAWFAKNGSLVNVNVAPGSNATANVSLPVSDSGAALEFVSLVPYQFQSGMYGTARITSGVSAGAYGLTIQTASNALAFVPDMLVVQNATSFPITVSVAVSNLGSTSHTFTLAGQNNLTLNPSNFTTYFQTHPPLANVQVPQSAGPVVYANFTITGKGAYQFICEVPGHYQAGMDGWLYVGWVPTPPPPPPGSALIDTPVLIGAGALLGLAVLFTLAATFAGRFPRSPGTGHH